MEGAWCQPGQTHQLKWTCGGEIQGQIIRTGIVVYIEEELEGLTVDLIC